MRQSRAHTAAVPARCSWRRSPPLLALAVCSNSPANGLIWPVTVTSCQAAGKGDIAAATFAMLFGLLAIFILHFHTTLNNWGRCAKLPYPRVLLLLSSFLSLTLYIVVVATYYSKCINQLQDVYYYCSQGSNNNKLDDVNPGYAIGHCSAPHRRCRCPAVSRSGSG